VVLTRQGGFHGVVLLRGIVSSVIGRYNAEVNVLLSPLPGQVTRESTMWHDLVASLPPPGRKGRRVGILDGESRSICPPSLSVYKH
jgi:hypothetical protein